MKKEYMQPAIKVIKVKTRHHLLQASAPIYNQNATGTALSPEFDGDSWDEDY